MHHTEMALALRAPSIFVHSLLFLVESHKKYTHGHCSYGDHFSIEIAYKKLDRITFCWLAFTGIVVSPILLAIVTTKVVDVLPFFMLHPTPETLQ